MIEINKLVKGFFSLLLGLAIGWGLLFMLVGIAYSVMDDEVSSNEPIIPSVKTVIMYGDTIITYTYTEKPTE